MSFGLSVTMGNPQIQLIEQLQTHNFCKIFKVTKFVFIFSSTYISKYIRVPGTLHFVVSFFLGY